MPSNGHSTSFKLTKPVFSIICTVTVDFLTCQSCLDTVSNTTSIIPRTLSTSLASLASSTSSTGESCI